MAVDNGGESLLDTFNPLRRQLNICSANFMSEKREGWLAPHLVLRSRTYQGDSTRLIEVDWDARVSAEPQHQIRRLASKVIAFTDDGKIVREPGKLHPQIF